MQTEYFADRVISHAPESARASAQWLCESTLKRSKSLTITYKTRFLGFGDDLTMKTGHWLQQHEWVWRIFSFTTVSKRDIPSDFSLILFPQTITASPKKRRSERCDQGLALLERPHWRFRTYLWFPKLQTFKNDIVGIKIRNLKREKNTGSRAATSGESGGLRILDANGLNRSISATANLLHGEVKWRRVVQSRWSLRKEVTSHVRLGVLHAQSWINLVPRKMTCSSICLLWFFFLFFFFSSAPSRTWPIPQFDRVADINYSTDNSDVMMMVWSSSHTQPVRQSQPERCWFCFFASRDYTLSYGQR